MRIVWGARRSGKTMEMIKYSAENGAVIVTRNQDTKREILETCKRLNITIPDPITFGGVLLGQHFHRGNYQTRYVIDDVEDFISRLFEREVDMVSFHQVERVIHKTVPHITPDWEIEP